MDDQLPAFSVSEFVALVNQTFEYAYDNVVITGELANFRVSKNKWVYFDLKDEFASVRFFGTVYQLPGPLEDGMLIQVRGLPRLHPQYGFSVTVQTMTPVGEGALKRAAELLEAKLRAEGLFDETRKRPLTYPPQRVGLVASRESAAYIDFMKVLAERWGGIEVLFIDVQVQGEIAPQQIAAAIEQFNQLAEPPEVLLVTRGGGSAEDLQAFSSELVTRAVAKSRIPTLVAIGHERDICLAELAADKRASTPSNAAELLVPDRQYSLQNLREQRKELHKHVERLVFDERAWLRQSGQDTSQAMLSLLQEQKQHLTERQQLLAVLDPEAALRRGYAIVRHGAVFVKSRRNVKVDDALDIRVADGHITARVTQTATIKKTGGHSGKIEKL